MVKDYQLERKWVDQEWGEWDALQSSSELSEITAGAQGKPHRAKAVLESKEKGKGPGLQQGSQ
eukprot:1812528-Pyramimonas_sp.AAC.1